MAGPSRIPWVGGNWKCNGTKDSITNLVTMLNIMPSQGVPIDVVVFPSPLHLLFTQSLLKKHIHLGSQNVSRTPDGAYTGETSVQMLTDAGISWTIIGHSERRQYYGETNQDVADKLHMCQEAGLHAVVCLGEDLQQRNRGETEQVLSEQLNAILPKIKHWSRVVLAYEPIWAIGTGVVASLEQIIQAHAFIRKFIRDHVNDATSQSVRIVYGGSVNKDNCTRISELEDVDGFLVGGASLKPDFEHIVFSFVH